MENELYDYSPIIEREPLQWPGDARVAFYVGLNVEHFLIGRGPGLHGRTELAPPVSLM